jgi:hypothetical protein
MSCLVHLGWSSFGDVIMSFTEGSGYVGQKELRQLHVIQKVLGGIIKQGEAAEILPLSSR